jgi:cyclohexyl-isocyanide hydratase
MEEGSCRFMEEAMQRECPNEPTDDPNHADLTWRRRDLLRWGISSGLCVAADVAAAAETVPTGRAAAEPSAGAADQASRKAPTIGMLVYDDMILMDLNGPQTVFSLLMANVLLISKDLTPVRTDVGIMVQPTASFETCPRDLDVLFVPGGLKGTIACMADRQVLDFVADRGRRARYVTSVCTGSVVLAAAGLLKGFRATSHWYVRDLLPLMGATLDPARVVEDRNRITGGGVTAGIDFALTLAARLTDEARAKRAQLVIEYDPQPPFAAGSPEAAGRALADDVRSRRAPLIEAARQLALAAARTTGGRG